MELAEELNMKYRFKKLLILAYHFSKYAETNPIRNKETIPVRIALA